MRSTAAFLTLTFLLPAASLGAGCAHETAFTSTPSGADVIIDGEVKGQTPLVWQQPLSGGQKRQVQIKGEAGTVDVELDESGFNTGGLVVPMAVGCVIIPALMFPVGVAISLGGSFAVASSAPAMIPVFLLSGNVIALSGCFGAFCGLPATAAATFFFGRAGPDAVKADLTSGKVVAEPADRASVKAAPTGTTAAQRY